LGEYPKFPPKPFISFRFKDIPDLIYGLKFAKDTTDYMIYDKSRNKRISKEEDPFVSGIDIELNKREDMEIPESKRLAKGWQVKLKIFLK